MPGARPEADGRVVSVQRGLPSPSLPDGPRRVFSAFRRPPVDGPVRVGPEGLEGDQVGDPSVHGGPEKAVYAYPADHHGYWRSVRPELSFGPGCFGENLTLAGILEGSVRPGDRLVIGSAEFRVTRPRFPCRKLGLHFGRPTMVKEFADAGRSGFYLGVVVPGVIAAGDPVRRGPRGPDGPSIAELFAAKVRRDAVAEAAATRTS